MLKIDVLQNKTKIIENLKVAIFTAVARSRFVAEAIYKEKFWRAEFKPLSRVSGMRKQPLRQLRYLITSKQKQPDNYIVGFRKQNEKYALWAEYGQNIKVTPKMRRYLAYKGFPVRKATEFINVPARPFFSEVKQEIEKKVPVRIGQYIKQYLENKE